MSIIIWTWNWKQCFLFLSSISFFFWFSYFHFPWILSGRFMSIRSPNDHMVTDWFQFKWNWMIHSLWLICICQFICVRGTLFRLQLYKWHTFMNNPFMSFNAWKSMSSLSAMSHTHTKNNANSRVDSSSTTLTSLHFDK